ncbi:MAG: hypothetical protein D6732_16865 [Methanobacteriota archaeon]|nr:MAG: hypothetical protein D6732_16865 [Euryarchaeota archaeon]
MSKESSPPKKQRIKLKTTFFRELKQKGRRRDLKDIIDFLEIDNIIGLTDLAKVVDILNQFAQSEKDTLIRSLISLPNNFQNAVGMKLAIESKWWETNLEDTKQLIKEFATHRFWQLRDLAAELLANLVIDLAEEKALLMEYATSSDVKERQMATNAVMLILKLEESVDQYNEVILTLLRDEDFLVRYSLAYNGFGGVGLKYHPERTIAFIQELAEKYDEEEIKECVLATLTHDLAKEYLEVALKILATYMEDTRNSIRRMRHSVLQNFVHENKEEIQRFLETRIESEEALDHWANLAAAGLFDEQ